MRQRSRVGPRPPAWMKIQMWRNDVPVIPKFKPNKGLWHKWTTYLQDIFLCSLKRYWRNAVLLPFMYVWSRYIYAVSYHISAESENMPMLPRCSRITLKKLNRVTTLPTKVCHSCSVLGMRVVTGKFHINHTEQLMELNGFARWQVFVCSLCSCSCKCEDKFVQECGVARLWDVVRFDFLLPRNEIQANECWGSQWCRSKMLAKSSLHRYFTSPCG